MNFPIEIDMFCKINSASFLGVEMLKINVEVDISDGLPNFDMVGLLNSEVKESRERVRTAIKNQSIILPPKRITINLSPVNVRKTGNYFDLAIAVGILKCLGIVLSTNLEDTLIVGELSLNGDVKKIGGILAIVAKAKELGFKKCIIPKENEDEGAVIDGINVYGVNSLNEAVSIINDEFKKEAVHKDIYEVYRSNALAFTTLDFADVYGNEGIKRAVMIAACGKHHLLMIGPPGVGKSMIASRIPTILPKPDMDECIEITKIHSIAGKLKDGNFMTNRPYRAPHHTITQSALVGGGMIPKMGEVTLAHKGVLFLDELAEFKPDTIDTLREPIENGQVIISRNSGKYVFPADIMLVGATNPCKCGYYPDRNRCNCSESQVKNYLNRISGPILDRLDICVNMEPIKIEEIEKNSKNISSSDMQKIVEKGRKIQKDRNPSGKFNSKLSVREIESICCMEKEAGELLRESYAKLQLSVRAYYKIIRVARTIADIEECEYINKKHMAEAINYRMVR